MDRPLVRPFLALLACVVAGALPARAAPAAEHSIFIPVLTLHHVKWPKPADDAIERGLTIAPAQFEQELDFLRRNGYHTATALQLLTYLRTGRGLPSRPVVLTFDDGYTDVYPDVYMVLRRYHMTATFFIVPGYVGTPRYLTWRQVEDMARHGMDIEAHTLTHPDLTTLPAARQWQEISASRTQLEKRLRRPVRAFAYPYGAYNPAIVAQVSRAGYWGAFATHQGWQASSQSPYTLPRLYDDNDDTLHIFAGRLRADPLVLAQDPT